MKKIFIVFTFIFISLLSFANNVNVGVRIPLGEQKVELDFNVKLLLGMIKAENNPKYKKLLDYIDENLAKKGEVKYSANISLKKASTEVFSENGELLYEEKLPEEFMNILNYSLATADDKAKVKKFIKGSYEKPAYMIISKNNGKPKIFIERSMEPDEHKIKTTTEVTLKRELTEAERKELLSLKNDKLITKYKSYVDSEISKAYTDNNLTMVQEFKNLTETAIIYAKNNDSIKKEVKYTDNSHSNGTMKSYKNDKLVEEIVFENSMPNLQKSYHDNGNLAFEIPMKNGAINGEVKIYYENGKIKEIIPVKNGKKEGIGREYNETGEIIKEVLYKDDEEVKKIK
nr:toxin-antitoxin system YwqK family antitoxin [uncultured Fusobacterium sp.]